MAAKEGEALVDAALGHLLEQGEIGEGKLTPEAVRRVLDEERPLPVTEADVPPVSLAGFDELLGDTSLEVRQ